MQPSSYILVQEFKISQSPFRFQSSWGYNVSLCRIIMANNGLCKKMQTFSYFLVHEFKITQDPFRFQSSRGYNVGLSRFMFDYVGKCRYFSTFWYKNSKYIKNLFDSNSPGTTKFYLLDFESLFYPCSRSFLSLAV
jgi:hypothetical protein